MTPRAARGLRAFLAPLLATLCYASTVVSPLLDATDHEHGPVFESKHDPSICGYGHDETICSQVTGNLAAASQPTPLDFDLVAHRFDAFRIRDEIAPRSTVFLPLGPRAPPLA